MFTGQSRLVGVFSRFAGFPRGHSAGFFFSEATL